MSIKKTILILLLVIPCFSLTSYKIVDAQNEISCNDRYLTLINPVRGRNLWQDQSIKPLEDQYSVVMDYGFSATWLLQYDALSDEEIVKFIDQYFNDKQEIGLFLEISLGLTKSARILYPPLTPWQKPHAVFLSGYSQSERIKLIETMFSSFKTTFGHYPASVGAWWVDSFSLDYMKNKYGIKTVLIVADQKTTDNYGVWGQWWGVPYYPSIANILIPAPNEKSKQDVVVVQWAQRDISKAYGESPTYSNYSLQANDYTDRGLDTSYFGELARNYLNCNLQIGQVTVGLETGMEGVGSFPEYKNQLKALSGIEGLQSVTMEEFSNRYRKIHQNNPEKVILTDGISEWILTLQGRENSYLGDTIKYQDNLAFTDYFIQDKSEFLNRRLPTSQPDNAITSRYFILLAFGIGYIVYRQLKLQYYFWFVSLFVVASYLTTLLDYSKYGRLIYYGPVLNNMYIWPIFIVITAYLVSIPMVKTLVNRVSSIKLFLLCLSLSYIVDFIVSILRYTQLHGQYYLGFAWDPLRFVGLIVTQKSLAFINQDFPSIVAGALLRFDYNLIWDSPAIALIVYPLVHLILGVLIYFVLIRLPKRMQYLAIFVLLLFFCLYVFNTLTLDPRVVL